MAIRSGLASAFETDLGWQEDAFWVGPALLAGALIYYIYLVTHPYPAFGAGLFLLIAEQVSNHGYHLPQTIPYYGEPIPFAYSPLMFYVVALLRDLVSVDGMTVARFLPGIVTIAYLVPFYFFVRELTGSRRIAGLAAFLVAVSPPVLQWQISAGGIVRAPAAFLTISGWYTGLRLFKEGGRPWLVASIVLFGLTVLTHPVYSVFFALSLGLMWLAFSRSIRGLADGITVGIGGAVLAAPWWTQVIRYHGVGIFMGAAGTHGGIGKQLPELVELFASRLFPGPARLDTVSQSGVLFNVQPHLFNLFSGGTLLLWVWFLFIIGAAVHLSVKDDFRASRRTVFLSGWLLVSMALVSKLRFSFLIGAIIFAVVVFEYGVPALDHVTLPWVTRRHVMAVILAFIGVIGLVTGGLYVGSLLDSHAGSTSQPQFIQDADVEAMAWAEANTEPDAQFVVMGDAAEWFPYKTHRRILVGPWGIEWLGYDAYQQHLRQFNELSTCRHEACVTGTLLMANIDPDYLYVPTSRYTVRGMETDPSPYLREELIKSPHYRLVYENAGVVIFEVDIDNVQAAEGAGHPPTEDRIDPETFRAESPIELARTDLGQRYPRTK